MAPQRTDDVGMSFTPEYGKGSVVPAVPIAQAGASLGLLRNCQQGGSAGKEATKSLTSCTLWRRL